jgi:hypothetical protein
MRMGEDERLNRRPSTHIRLANQIVHTTRNTTPIQHQEPLDDAKNKGQEMTDGPPPHE